MARTCFSTVVLGIAVSVLGCKKGGDSSGGDKLGDPAAATAPVLAALKPVGMDDPFARLTGDGAKDLNAGYKALKAKKYDEAQAAFGKVVAANPDYTAARWQALRATVLAGKTDVVDQWSDILARDYIAYAGRLDKPKDLAPLRAAPEWAKVKELEGRYQTAYSAGLDRGFVFVARTRDDSSSHFNDAGESKLDLHQEIYHYEPTSKRYRRLTETDGHIFALNQSPDRKTVAFLVVDKVAQGHRMGEILIMSPKGGSVNLTTLATTGPFPIKGSLGSFQTITLQFTGKGEPAWKSEERAWLYDSALTALVENDAAKVGLLEIPVTSASYATVWHVGVVATADVKVADDSRSFSLPGVEKPVIVARAVSPGSIEWSPAKKRLAYAGTVDACKLMVQGGKADKGDRNELYLFDVEKKSASRVAQAVSQFETLWLDDDQLVYEGGVGKEGKLHLFTVSTRDDQVLKPRYGAGLYGYPSLDCVEGERDDSPPGDSAEVDVGD